MTTRVQLGPGTRLGRYEVLEAIGSGGMGEVYRALDTRLRRVVAVKTLGGGPEGSSLGRARFEREARAIAGLNHPHICTLHDIGHHNGVDFIVMEYLGGELLGKRLDRGALALSQVLRHGEEICSALGHAHRHGFVHRDVKPSNIMLTPMGAKLLDFGIAKSQPIVPETGEEEEPGGLSLGATLTVDGALVGTVQYMAPEQLEGMPTDARTDVFAVGLVLYEMAAGRPAFEGRSAASVIAKVLSGAPEPVHIPDLRLVRAFDSTLARCLAKCPDDRWQSIDDLKGELQWMLDTITDDRRSVRRVDPPALLRDDVPVARFLVDPPPGHTFVKFGTQVGLSPDGRHLAWVAAAPETGSRLWIRPIGATAARELPDTEGAAGPFWSPDSRCVGFFTKGTLRQIALTDERSEPIGEAPVGTLGSGTWSSDGTIIIGSPDTGLFQLSASGGRMTPLTHVDHGRQDRGHTNPHFLPDGRHFLFLLRTNDSARAGVYLATIDDPGRQRLLLRSQFKAEYAEPSALLFLRHRTLWAQPFDLGAVDVTGAPQKIAEHVAFNEASGRASFSGSHADVLSYHAVGPTQLVWFDRAGSPLGAIDVSDFDADPAISPDASLVAFSAIDPHSGTRDLCIYEVSMNRLRRITGDGMRNDIAPVWSPDARRLAFASDGGEGRFDLYLKSLDTGHEELLFRSAEDNWPLDWSRDGRFLLFRRGTDFRQLWALPLEGARPPLLLASGTPSVAVGRISPDGRWLAYVSGETGKEEVFIRSFPAGGRRVKVSQEGGAEPIWRADGGELIYLTRKGCFMAVAVTARGEGIELGHREVLFHTPLIGSSSLGALARNQYDVTGDGRRFLVNLPREDVGAVRLTVVVNWSKGLPGS